MIDYITFADSKRGITRIILSDRIISIEADGSRIITPSGRWNRDYSIENYRNLCINSSWIEL